jgi:hypothetical protein
LAENLSIFLAKSGYQSMMDPGQEGQDGQDSLGENSLEKEKAGSKFKENYVDKDH